MIQESPIATANKILQERREQKYSCEESKCEEVFGSHAQMYFHWLTTHKMGKDSQVETLEKQSNEIVDLENDGNKENQLAVHSRKSMLI